MTPISIGVLAVSMSVDAFIASLGKGASNPRPNFSAAIKTGAIFGCVETLTPLIGWLAGMAASQYVEAVDHWIAFALLGAVGAHMVLQAWNRQESSEPENSGVGRTIATAIGTSIDAMAVGVSLAFLEVNIILIALCIGAVTMLMSSAGMLTGRFLGQQFGRVAEAVGGFLLVGLGTLILFEHLTAA